MPKTKAAPNFNPMLEEGGDALTDEEKAAQLAEERGETPATPEQPEGEGQQTAEPAEPEQKGKERKSTTVPYDRFQEVVEERNRIRQEAEQARQEVATQREQWARLQERQRMAEEAQNRAAQAAQAAERAKLRPDPDVDPGGARAWDAEQRAIAAEQRVGQLEQFVQGRSQQFEGAIQQTQLGQWVQGQANLGRQKYAYYDSAVDFARDARRKFWQSVGHSEQAAANIVQNEEAALVQSASQAGVQLADAVINMATQWGFKPPANGQPRPANGNVKLDQIAAGQRVQGLGRTQSAETPSQKQWQVMDNQEFANFIVNMDDQDYIEMTKDKAFSKRVTSLDTGA